MSITIDFGANPGDASEAQIPVEVVNGGLETVWQGTTALSGGVTVPVSEPGLYLVRATLPSGELMTSTVRVTGDQSATATLRPPRRSPNEGLAWAYYLQRGPARSGVRPRASGLESFRIADDLAFGVEVLPHCDFWLLHRDNSWRLAAPADLTTQPVPITPGDPTAVMATEVSALNANATVWVSVDWEGHQQLVAVPVWSDQHIRMLILRDDRNERDSPPFRVLVGGSHPQSEAILGFLTTGDFDAARRIGDKWLDEAEAMLRDKVADPMGAIIAGYFLLRAGDAVRLHGWAPNLAEWFPSIPDGAVICGWHMALTNRWDLAEHWLTEAVARGIPLYTQGLRLLHDGLRILLTRGAKVEPQFERVRAIAARAKWTSSVTCLVSTEPHDLQEPGNP